MTRKPQFFEGWSWFVLNNLGLVLETLHQCDKRFKTKSQKVFKFNSYIGEVAGEKLVGETFLLAIPSRIGLIQYLKIAG